MNPIRMYDDKALTSRYRIYAGVADGMAELNGEAQSLECSLLEVRIIPFLSIKVNIDVKQYLLWFYNKSNDNGL